MGLNEHYGQVTRAAASRRGSSPSSSRPSCARRFDPSARNAGERMPFCPESKLLVSLETRGEAMKRIWTRVAILIGGVFAMTQTSMEARPEAAAGGTTAEQAQAKTGGGADAIRPFRAH